MTDFCSIIVTTYRNGNREKISKQSIISLLENTGFPYEIILVDNTQNNVGLSVGRNEGYIHSHGNYICFTDDDIDYQKGWLEECIKMVNLGDKFLATPVHQPRVRLYEMPRVCGYRQNWRTGSNCMVMRRDVIENVGLFYDYTKKRGIKYDIAKTGREFSTRLSRAGYSFLVTKEPLAWDMGFKRHSYL